MPWKAMFPPGSLYGRGGVWVATSRLISGRFGGRGPGHGAVPQRASSEAGGPTYTFRKVPTQSCCWRGVWEESEALLAGEKAISGSVLEREGAVEKRGDGEVLHFEEKISLVGGGLDVQFGVVVNSSQL